MNTRPHFLRDYSNDRQVALDAIEARDTQPGVQIAHTYPACNDGPCRQGRAICPAPESCQLPERGHARRPGIAVRLHLWTRGWHSAERVMLLILVGVLVTMAFGWLR